MSASTIKRNALGKGLGALLADRDAVAGAKETNMSATESAIEGIPTIPIAYIQTNPYQPRTEFEAEALQELADSITVHGIIQPLTVRKLTHNSYQLISGERRFRASQLAGLTEVPVYVRTANDQEMLEMALIENIQRKDLNAIEVAISFQRMIDECNLKQEELGDRVGKNRSTVTNYLRLLKLPPVIQSAIKEQRISMGHARAIINIETIDKQIHALNEIITKDLSVRKVEELVRNLSTPTTTKTAPVKTVSVEYRKIADGLSSRLGTKTDLVVDNSGKGQIKINFTSTDDLNRILEMLDW